MTWHNTSHHIASNDVTITWPDPGTDIKTSKHFTSKHKTSPPWKGRRLVHSKEMIWASRWSVTMRTFYRQILSVLYSSFPFGNFRPRLVRALLVYIYIFICGYIGGWDCCCCYFNCEVVYFFYLTVMMLFYDLMTSNLCFFYLKLTTWGLTWFSPRCVNYGQKVNHLDG